MACRSQKMAAQDSYALGITLPIDQIGAKMAGDWLRCDSPKVGESSRWLSLTPGKTLPSKGDRPFHYLDAHHRAHLQFR